MKKEAWAGGASHLSMNEKRGFLEEDDTTSEV